MVSSAAHSLEDSLVERLETLPLHEVYRWLVDQDPLPADDMSYHRWLGQIALELGDYAAAAAHLESAVLADPMDLGSRLELAISYTEMGNVPAARASIRALYYHLDGGWLPSAAAAQLAKLEERLMQGEEPHRINLSRRFNGHLTVGQGYDSNANLGARHRIIPLNLWGVIPMQAELADASRAQSSHYSNVELIAQTPFSAWQQSAFMSGWQLLAGGGIHHYHQLDTLHRQDLLLGALWLPEKRAEQLSVIAQRQRIEGADTLWSLSSDYRRMLGPYWMLGVGGQWRQEPGSRYSHEWHVSLWREWRRALLWGQASWQFRPERPAGDTRRLKVGLDSPSLRWLGVDWRAYAVVEHRQDQAPYSRQFFGDIARQETTASLGARMRYTLSEELDVVLGSRWEQTWGNLELFENRRWTLEAKLEWGW